MNETTRKKVRHREPLPDFDISTVLEALVPGCDIPTGFGWVRLHCPFHEDRTASAGVNHDKNGFRCFSCQRQGDSLKLYQQERGLSFKEALEALGNLTGIRTDKPTVVRKRRSSDLLKRGGDL
jgi:hypothetical protein